MSGTPNALATEIAERYAIECVIGHGATAIVYRARDRREDRIVAIKVLRTELSQAAAIRRFLREIRRHSGLHHPNILQVLDAGEWDGKFYFVMPFMEGGTLRKRLERERQLPIADAVAIARTIAIALHHAHQHGLIHRDVKPENILFSAGEPCLADFGIARALEGAPGDTSTSAGMVRGTVAYMSPEQASAEHDYDGRSDVYSLGCVLYEMLAGVPAFIGPTAEAVLAQRFAHSPREVRVYRPTVSPALEAVVKKALQFAPADRFRTAEEMAAALSADNLTAERVVLEAEGDRGRPHRTSTPSPRRRAVRIATAAVIAAIVMLVTVQQLALSGNRLRERDWILVGDFEGPTDDPAIATAVRELVTAELNQSRFVGTVSRQQLNSVMRLAGVAETTHVDAALARELAVRSSVRAIVVGSIQRLGNGRYSVAIHVVNADDGRDLHSVATSAAARDLVPAIGQLARGLRRSLGEKRKAVEATLPLAEAATPSFAAYQKYVEAFATVLKGNAAGSNARFREAIALDPQFASAWAGMGANYLGTRQLDSAQMAFTKALEIPGRLTAAQQYRLKGDIAYAIQYDVPAAVRWYDLFLAEVPQSIGGYNNRALYLSAVGRYEDAIADLRHAIAINPFGPQQVQIILFNLAAMLVSVGKLAEAEAALVDLKPPLLTGGMALIALARDRWSEVTAIANAIDSIPNAHPLVRLLGTTGRASALAARGSLTAAEVELRRARDVSTGATARWYERARLLLTVASGRSRLPPSVDVQRDSTAGGVFVRALRAAIAGDTLSAHQELARLQGVTSRDFSLLGHGPAVVRGWIAAHAGRWNEITRSLAAASLAGEHEATLLDRVSSIEIRWLVATAYAALGAFDSAAIHMQRGISPEGVPAGHLALRGLVLPMALFRLASWSHSAGQDDEKISHLQAIVRTVTNPDTDLAPLVRQARTTLENSNAAH
jgi:serine/threonine-protein kinase